MLNFPNSSPNPSFSHTPHTPSQPMDEVMRGEAKIEALSKKIEVLFALKRAHKGTSDSDVEEELQYWIKEKDKEEEALRKVKEALRREKEMLLLQKPIMDSKAIMLPIFSKVIIGIVILTQSIMESKTIQNFNTEFR
jgi:hypothetical protein